jgi:hypothetical protein
MRRERGGEMRRGRCGGRCGGRCEENCGERYEKRCKCMWKSVKVI